MKRSLYRIAGTAVVTGITVACGASRSNESAPQTPASESAAPAPAPATRPGGEDLDEEPAAGSPSAGAMPPSSTKSDREGAASDLDTWGSRLDSALSLSTPDCTTAWALRDRICDLAQRLCDMAGRSAEPDIAERCSDGRARCEHATTRVRASCAD